MNRGQPPQRPPNLGPTPALNTPFRPPYPGYGIAPRNVMPSYPTLPNHRAQNIVPQPTPNYIQRSQQNSGYPFQAGLAGQQQTQQQQQQHPPLQHPQPSQQPQQSTNSSNLLPPNSTTPNLGTNHSASSASEVGLDPNDFPALGSTPATNSASNQQTNLAQNNTTSYATQAGGATVTGSGNTQSGTTGLTAEDFPALGGSQTTHQQSQNQSQHHDLSHPPGLNGFSDQNHRPGIISGITPGTQQPGVLNIGQQQRLHQFQSEADKRNFNQKLNQSNHAAWPSPNPTTNQNSQPTYPGSLQNGSGHQSHLNQAQQQQQPQSQQQTQQSQQTQQPRINPPPGVPTPNAFPPQTQSTPAPFPANGTGADPIHMQSQGPTNASAALPQTPAQQVLVSPADRWGLLGLIALIKSTDPDSNLLSVGTDLGTMGLDMQQNGYLYSTFITPWADSSAAHSVEPDFHLPSCYNVQAPPPGAAKAQGFTDETLFYMFYSCPRDALQEIAAQELYSRNWRYHKEMRLWLTKEQGLPASQKILGGEQGAYTYWDPDNWEKARKEMAVVYSDLEDRGTPGYPANGGSQGQQVGVGAVGTPGVGVVQQAQLNQNQRVAGGYPGIGM